MSIDLFLFFNRKIRYNLIYYWLYIQIVSQKRNDVKNEEKLEHLMSLNQKNIIDLFPFFNRQIRHYLTSYGYRLPISNVEAIIDFSLTRDNHDRDKRFGK